VAATVTGPFALATLLLVPAVTVLPVAGTVATAAASATGVIAANGAALLISVTVVAEAVPLFITALTAPLTAGEIADTVVEPDAPAPTLGAVTVTTVLGTPLRPPAVVTLGLLFTVWE
jgi:hypothetical protein